MSNRNNDVYSVLPTSGNQALLTAGNTEDDLLPGQLGCFDSNTGLSVATLAAVRDFYFVLGIDRGTGALDDIRKSAGQFIQRQGVVGISFKAHSPGRPQISKVGGYSPKCDTDYAVKVEFRNSRIYRMQGFNQFAKTYNVRTGCCEDCGTGCESDDANNLTKLLIAEINNDESGILLAQAVARKAITTVQVTTLSQGYALGAVMTPADVDALIIFNALQTTEAAKFFTDILLTSVPLVLQNFAGTVNLGFHKFTQTVLIVSLSDGFSCSGAVTTVQEVAFEEGSGNTIRQKEYYSLGWGVGGPYAASDVTGTAFAIDYLSVQATKYDQYIVEYNQKSESGWLEYENPLSTIIAVPATSTVTRQAVATLFATIPNFETLVDDAAAANVNPAVVEITVVDVTKDGLA